MKGLAWHERVSCHGRFKLLILLILPAVFACGYFPLQQAPLFPPRSFELSAIDRLIAFEPRWIHVYQSLYLLMPLAPLFVARRDALKSYVRGFLWLCAVSFLIFVFFPVSSPRPEVATGVAAFDLLTAFEGKLNAFPSLHAGLLAYSLFFTRDAYRDELPATSTRLLLLGGVIWGMLILYATLATKQHYAVDLPAGIVLAWMCHRLSYRTLEKRIWI